MLKSYSPAFILYVAGVLSRASLYGIILHVRKYLLKILIFFNCEDYLAI